jgi:hypothetical protein
MQMTILGTLKYLVGRDRYTLSDVASLCRREVRGPAEHRPDNEKGTSSRSSSPAGFEVERFDGARPAERHLPGSRVVMLKILLINVALALGFVLLLLLFLYWLSGEVDGDFGKFGVLLLDILGT